MDNEITHASLFTGIGGFDLAAEWMGWQNVFQVEIDPFSNKVLEKNFPHAKRYGDIKQFDGKPYRGAIDVLTGGFPCQPFSTAGKRKGTEDDRHLWPEMLRVIGEIQPRFVVGENVYGLINWSEGLVFEQVQTDLENEGYEVTSVVLPACGKNAPHRRNRIWFIAYNKIIRRGERIGKETINRKRETCKQVTQRTEIWTKHSTISGTGISPNTKCIGQSGSWKYSKSFGDPKDRNWQASWSIDAGTWPNESPIRIGDDGLSTDMVRSSIEAAGNAVVPQIVYSIFKSLNL